MASPMLAAIRSKRGVDPQTLRRAFHTLIRRFGLLDSEKRPCGSLAVSHAHALLELLQVPVTKQGDLARNLGLSKSAISRMVTQLESSGYVERIDDSQDGRVRYIKLTTKGRRVASEIDTLSLRKFSQLLDGIPVAAHDQVVSALEILLRAIPAAGDE